LLEQLFWTPRIFSRLDKKSTASVTTDKIFLLHQFKTLQSGHLASNKVADTEPPFCFLSSFLCPHLFGNEAIRNRKHAMARQRSGLGLAFGLLAFFVLLFSPLAFVQTAHAEETESMGTVIGIVSFSWRKLRVDSTRLSSPGMLTCITGFGNYIQLRRCDAEGKG
jgi:hypothetical protein